MREKKMFSFYSKTDKRGEGKSLIDTIPKRMNETEEKMFESNLRPNDNKDETSINPYKLRMRRALSFVWREREG